MKRLAIHFARFGPYHLARIEAAATVLPTAGWEVVGLETSGNDATYAWEEERGDTGWERRTVFPGEVLERIPAKRIRTGMAAALDDLRPDAVAIAGWGSPDARACLDWCRKRGAKAIVMSETREVDGVRVWWKEWIKGRIIRRFDGALVGGKSHRDYLVKLGIPEGRIAFGYDVVDNGYFAGEAGDWRPEAGGRGPYFLASNRFIERKNLGRLIEAYARFLNQPSTLHSQPSTSWNLCLLGDGEEKPVLLTRCRELGLRVAECAPWETPASDDRSQPAVFFPGFRQIEELPRFYAHAGCFVHPALEEPWGLVLNEAMACGLPVLSGNNVGAAEELVDEGVNGWTFDATDVDDISRAVCRVAGLSADERREMGRASEHLLEERCPEAAFGEGLAKLLDPSRKA